MNTAPASTFRLILFDLGNTLTYFQGDWDQTIELAIQRLDLFLKAKGIIKPNDLFTQPFSEALKKYYIERDIDCLETAMSVLLSNLLLKKFNSEIDEILLAAALDIFYTTTGEHWFVDEYAIELLTGLKNSGFQLGLISNASHAPDVYQQITSLGLAPFFNQVLISAEVGLRKPHPAIFHMALDFFGCKAEQAVMVGDTLNADILGSRKIGMKNVWVRRWTSPTSTHVHDDAIVPDKTIQYLFELPSLLEWWV